MDSLTVTVMDYIELKTPYSPRLLGVCHPEREEKMGIRWRPCMHVTQIRRCIRKGKKAYKEKMKDQLQNNNVSSAWRPPLRQQKSTWAINIYFITIVVVHLMVWFCKLVSEALLTLLVSNLKIYIKLKIWKDTTWTHLSVRSKKPPTLNVRVKIMSINHCSIIRNKGKHVLTCF